MVMEEGVATSQEAEEQHCLLASRANADLFCDPSHGSAGICRRGRVATAVLTALALCSAAVAWRQGRAAFGANVGSSVQLFMPKVHAECVKLAFAKSYADASSQLKNVVSNYKRVAWKITDGTCSTFSCKASRGPTDCLEEQCLCQYGFVTLDKGTCVNMVALKADAPQITTGTCGWFSCKSWRGPTDCIKGKCVCKAGYHISADMEKCTDKTTKDTDASGLTNDMMVAGVVEPDELPCPGSTVEMASQGALMLAGWKKYEVGTCRLGIQFYHGSPFPLVSKDKLTEPTVDNGDLSTDNLGVKGQLYSLITNRQWRTAMAQLMSRQFVYSIVNPDLPEAARRLGNLFHALTDTWSASHVVRKKPSGVDDLSDPSFDPSITICSQFKVGDAISMDTVNWAVHSMADGKENALWKCAGTFVKKAIDIWAEVRHDAGVVNDAMTANAAIDRLVNEVICPSLSIDLLALDKPAGGATKEWSAGSGSIPNPLTGSVIHLKEGHPVLPMGVASTGDAARIVEAWEQQLTKARNAAEGANKVRFAKNLFLPDRAMDVCAFPEAAHVDDTFIKEAKPEPPSNAPNYLMVAPKRPFAHPTKAEDSVPNLGSDDTFKGR